MSAQAGNWLADEDVKERIALSRRRIEHVNGSDCFAVDPAVGRDPASVGMRRSSTQFSGNRVPTLRGEILLRLLQRHVRSGEIHDATESVVNGSGQIVRELALQH